MSKKEILILSDVKLIDTLMSKDSKETIISVENLSINNIENEIEKLKKEN